MPTFCPHYDHARCRSCDWIGEAYEAQLGRKEAVLRQALGFFPDLPLEASAPSPVQGFRNRAKMVVTGTAENPIIGLIGEGELDAGRELLSCPIHHPRLNEVLEAMPAWIREFNLVPYRIRERQGELKGIIAYYSPLSDQMYVRFVLRSKECVSRLRKLLPALQARFPSVTCVSANLQPVPHAILEGREEIILTGQSTIDHQLGPVRLKLAPQAFVQTNAGVATELYQTAATWIAEAAPERAMELFCGQGAFSIFAARGAGRMLGIEINEEAVRAANESARELGLAHLAFKALDATQVEGELREFRPDLVLANPPRRGLADAVSLIAAHRPANFLYSSCAVDSLASDLRKLSGLYRIKRARVFDMFPHTAHFETLVWLELA